MKHKKSLAAISLIAALCAAIYLSGCVAGSRGIKFSHEFHADKAKCEECHASAARATEASCKGCHDIDRAKPGEACLLCHTKDNHEVADEKPDNFGDVIFDHSAHTDTSCEECHGDTRPVGDSVKLPSMDACSSCHDGSDAPSECSTCHETYTRDYRPADHNNRWDKSHGLKSKADDSCSYCHTEDQCIQCHTTEKPRSHRPSWTKSGHGVAADFDREQCTECHQADYCSTCHQTKPSNHFRAGFRFPVNGGGHAGLVAKKGGARSCAVCHETGFCSTCHSGSN